MSTGSLDVQDLTKSRTVYKHTGRGNIIFILNWKDDVWNIFTWSDLDLILLKSATDSYEVLICMLLFITLFCFGLKHIKVIQTLWMKSSDFHQ